MSNIFYPNDPRRGYRSNRRPEQEPRLTVEDYEKLAAHYQELKRQFEQQSKTLSEQAKLLEEYKNELAIKTEALQRQGEDLKQTESNLLWTRAALEQAEKAQAENWQEKYALLQAEMESVRKRWEQRHAFEVNEARNRILEDMLPLADHLDMALQHAATLEPEGFRSFVANIEATRQAFLETLKRYGVERLDATGQRFDPNLHEAIGYVVDAQTPADHVIQMTRAGYLDGERVLRAARVVVSKGSE
jgi:molecular chaperone GrpE